MYVCLCNGITESQVRDAAVQGLASLPELRANLGVATCCGQCADCALEIAREAANACSGRARAAFEVLCPAT